MILYVCYDDSCENFYRDVHELCDTKFPLVEVIGLSTDDYKEKKKAYKLKGAYSARLNPFMLLSDDNNEYLRAFYSENKKCTIEELTNFMSSWVLYNNYEIFMKNEGPSYQQIKE